MLDFEVFEFSDFLTGASGSSWKYLESRGSGLSLTAAESKLEDFDGLLLDDLEFGCLSLEDVEEL